MCWCLSKVCSEKATVGACGRASRAVLAVMAEPAWAFSVLAPVPAHGATRVVPELG